MLQFLKNAVSEVLLTFSIQRSQIEAMMKIDFKIGHERTNLMQLCFSNLAIWPLLLFLGSVYILPANYGFTLQKLFQNNFDFIFWLLDGRLANIALFFVIFFVAQWIFRAEYLFITLVFYFLSKSDLHFHLALSAISAIIFSRCCYLWWLHIDLKSHSKKTWQTFQNFQILGWFIASLLSFYLVEVLQFDRYFSENMTTNRFEIVLLALVLINLFQFVLSSLWGHFEFQKVKEPTDFPICYSTTTWILRFKMRAYFRKQIKQQIEKYLKLHQDNLDELKTIKDLSPVSIPVQISKVLETEIEYLKTASSRLTID